MREPDKDLFESGASDKFESHLPAEGINTSTEHPLKEFVSLLLAGIVIVAVVVIGLSFAAGFLAPKIPFSYEVALAERFSEQLNDLAVGDLSGSNEVVDVSLAEQRQRYLDDLLARYIQAQPLPEGVQIRLHYVDDPTVNAFATLGGNIFIHAGLFDVMASENALAFVLGHEIGHVVERHPIASLGRGLVVVVAVSAMLGVSDSLLPDWLLSQTTNITMMSFSRTQEAAADQYALNGLERLYGHVDGGGEFFQYLQREHSDDAWNIELLQTHPLHQSRIQAVHSYATSSSLNESELVLIPESLKR